MSDVRATLAEALGAHGINRYGQHDGWWECVCNPSQPFSPEHLADVILAAPGVTTIALPPGVRNDRGWTTYGGAMIADEHPGQVGRPTGLHWISPEEAREAAAALLAAADAAEAANNA